MKKIVAIILAVIMIMSFATVAFAANSFTDISNSKNKEAIETLYELGVIDGYSKTKFSPKLTLSRAEACAIMVRALYGDKIVYWTNSFTDVPARAWYAPYVDAAVYYDIMHGHNATTFAPDKDITYDQMATLVLNALGYNAPQLSGTWPENVQRIANVLGLYDNTSRFVLGSDVITREDACQMLYNALDCYVVEYVRGRIVETDQTLYEKMGFSYEPEYIYATGTITDLVDVSDYYRTNTYYYLITLNDYNTYLVNSDTKLDVKDYIEIYTDKKTIYHSDYLWVVSYVSKNIIDPSYIQGIVEEVVIDSTTEPYDDGVYIWTTYFVTIKDKGTFVVYTYNLFNTGDTVILTPVVGSTHYNLTVIERADFGIIDPGFTGVN